VNSCLDHVIITVKDLDRSDGYSLERSTRVGNTADHDSGNHREEYMIKMAIIIGSTQAGRNGELCQMGLRNRAKAQRRRV
jgi:hypothetical protein